MQFKILRISRNLKVLYFYLKYKVLFWPFWLLSLIKSDTKFTENSFTLLKFGRNC